MRCAARRRGDDPTLRAYPPIRRANVDLEPDLCTLFALLNPPIGRERVDELHARAAAPDGFVRRIEPRALVLDGNPKSIMLEADAHADGLASVAGGVGSKFPREERGSTYINCHVMISAPRSGTSELRAMCAVQREVLPTFVALVLGS